jgi:hypothetical protein
VIARSANVLPNAILWDPMYNRATVFIEAAKYWPLAHYHGMDSSIPNFEHAKMNADLTKTSLTLVEGPTSSSGTGKGSIRRQRVIESHSATS